MYLTILIHGNLDIGVAASVGFVEETNDSSESTVIDWKWMAANGTMLQWMVLNVKVLQLLKRLLWKKMILLPVCGR